MVMTFSFITRTIGSYGRILTGVIKSRGLLYRVGEGKDRSRETSEEAAVVVNVRNGNGLNWKWRESRKIMVKTVDSC